MLTVFYFNEPLKNTFSKEKTKQFIFPA